MRTKYAIRAPRFTHGDKHTNRADGMYIRRKDHLMTDHPPNAELFDNVIAAEAFIDQWRATTSVQVPKGTPLFIVQVETKEILHRQTGVIGAR